MNLQSVAQRIEQWLLIDRLIPYACNPRTHSPAQVAQIAASIHEFGFVNPILVAADGAILPVKRASGRPKSRACVN
jgi:hypothetical protein